MKLVAVGRRTFFSFISSHGRPRPRPPSPSRRFFSSLQQQETEERGPFSDKLLRLADQIAGLSNPELSRMSTDLRRMLGLPEPSATMGPMPGFDGASLEAAPAQEEEKPPEKTSFDLRIEKFEAASKIKVIKEVRAFTNLGLKEAKELVEKVPTVFKTGVEKEEALQIIEKLKLAGATVIME